MAQGGKIIKRKDIKDPILKKMLRTEKHHKHEIVKVNGTLYWNENQRIVELTSGENLDREALLNLFAELGCNWNSEIIRKLYRYQGYSLNGYYEVFYDECNNVLAKKYVPNKM